MTLESLLALMEVSVLQMDGHLSAVPPRESAGKVTVRMYEVNEWRKEMKLAMLHLRQMQRSGH